MSTMTAKSGAIHIRSTIRFRSKACAPHVRCGSQADLQRDRLRRLRVLNLQAVAAVGLVLAISTWSVFAPRPRQEPLPSFDLARIGLGLAPRPAEAVTVPAERRHELAVRRVPLESDSVVFYRIASLQPDPDPAE